MIFILISSIEFNLAPNQDRASKPIKFPINQENNILNKKTVCNLNMAMLSTI